MEKHGFCCVRGGILQGVGTNMAVEEKRVENLHNTAELFRAATPDVAQIVCAVKGSEPLVELESPLLRFNARTSTFGESKWSQSCPAMARTQTIRGMSLPR